MPDWTEMRRPQIAAYECLTSFYGYRRSYRRDLFPAVRERLERMVIADPVPFGGVRLPFPDLHRRASFRLCAR